MSRSARLAIAAFWFAGLACLNSVAATDPAGTDANTDVTALEPTGGDETVQLEKYTVTTTIGGYTETRTEAGTKVPIELKNLPATLQVLNASFLSDRKAESLEDIYPFVAGMTRSAAQANGFTLRGFNNQGGAAQQLRVIQTDGMPGMTQRQGSPSASGVERLEVLKGPASLLYGMITPGGMINIVTKSPKERRETSFYSSVASYASSDVSKLGDDMSFIETFDTTGPVDKNKKLLYRLVFSYEDLRSFRHNVFSNNYFVYPSLTYRWSPDTTLDVKFEGLKERRLPDDGLIAPAGVIANIPNYSTVYQEPTDRENELGGAASTAFKHVFTNKWTLRAATRSAWQSDWRQTFANNAVTVRTPLTDSTVTRRLSRNHNYRRVHAWDVNAYGTVGPESFSNTILVGVGGTRQMNRTQRSALGPNAAPINLYTPLLGVTPYPVQGLSPNDVQINLKTVGAYVTDHIKFGKHFALILGARNEKVDTISVDALTGAITRQNMKATVPMVAGVIDFNEHVSIYGSYAESFIPNNLAVVDINNSNNWDPEQSHQYEGGVKWAYLNNKLKGSLAYFNIVKNNVLVNTGLLNSAGNFYSRLDGQQKVVGLEFEGNWQPRDYWQIQVNAAYLQTAKTSKTNDPNLLNKRLDNTPKLGGSLWTRYNFPTGGLKGFGLGLGVTRTGLRVAGDGTTGRFEVPGYVRVDTAFYYTLKRYSFTLYIANVADKRYILGTPQGDASGTARGIVPGDPRKITASVRVQF